MSAPNPTHPVEVDSFTGPLDCRSENSDGTHTSSFSFAGIPWPAIAILLLTTLISLLWSSFSLLNSDELQSLFTDRVSSLAQVWHIQSTSPISSDPIAYHAFAHALILIFGANAFALRLPSLIGYLVMQICLFIFVRRIAGEQAALLAMAFPSLVGAFFYYSTEGRPYGMMLGLMGVAMVSWQSATRLQSKRSVPLILLALALALILNTHYSGVVLFAPFCIAELFRTCQRRRLDLPVAGANCMGGAGIVFVLPLMKAILQKRENYYFPLDLIRPLTIVWTYIRLLSARPGPIQDGFKMSPILIFVLAIMAFALWGLILRWRRGGLLRLDPQQVFLAVLVALPVFSFLEARFATHVFQHRHSVSLVIGVAAFTGIGLATYSWGRRTRDFILIFFLFTTVVFGVRNILLARSAAQEMLANLIVTPDAKAALMADPSNQLYYSAIGYFAYEIYYQRDPYIRAHSAFVYSREIEMRLYHMDTSSFTAINMRNFTDFNIVPYESLVTQPGDHLFVVYPSVGSNKADWVSQALSEAHAEVTTVGHTFGGDVVSVRFRP